MEGYAYMDQYSLRLYDEELLTFSLEENGLEGIKTKEISDYEKNAGNVSYN